MKPRDATRAAQAGHFLDPETGALVHGVVPSTTFARRADYTLFRDDRDYARDRSPAFEPAEHLLAELEGGVAARLYASGMSAGAAVFRLLGRGEHAVLPRAMYWGLRAFARDEAARVGWELSEVDAADTAAIARAVVPGRTRLLWVETPANPTWDVTDIAAAAGVGRAAGALVVVDSTCATPVHTKPLGLGADLVLHSATKYLNGHGDVLAGVLVTREASDAWSRLGWERRHGGAVPGAFEAWLLVRGLRTLFVRVERQSRSALALARRLEGHAALDAVLYPGLPSHPGHEVACRQMQGGFGGMLSLRVRGGRARALEVASRLDLFARATSLGGTESLVEHRATVEGAGSRTPDDLLRLSVGLEDVDDLHDDLDRALSP